MSPTRRSPRPIDLSASRRRLLAAALAVAATPLLGGTAAARDAAAEAFIQDVGNRTVAILKNPGLSQQQRLDQLVDILNQSTDLILVGRLVLGQYWRTATESQRNQFLEVFRALVVKTMADNLNRYSGETFVIANSNSIDDRDSLVSTQIVRPGVAQPTHVDWRVRKQDGKFQIIDIIAEGVSMVVTQRSEVAEVVSQQGMDGLIATLKGRLQGRA
jgi:phospholipid transport system substrate-binding protein